MIQSSYIVEALLITGLICLCISETISDLKTGTVRNRSLLIAAGFALAADIVYYGFMEREYLVSFLLNSAVIMLVALVFYALHIWAAGDSKLLMTAIILVPARFYYAGDNIIASVGIMILIFSIAYLYLLIESIYLGARNKDFFRLQRIKVQGKRMFFQYVRCVCLVTLFSTIMYRIFPDFYTDNPILMMIIDMVIILGGYHLNVFYKALPLLMLIIATIAAVLLCHGEIAVIRWRIYVLVVVVFILRLLMDKYNYEEISTEQVQPGMVLSYSTVLGFTTSRIKGLPRETTEDVRSRITKEEAESIQRWGKSTKGKDTVTIVRKIPFAIFISVGVLLFLGINIVML